MTSSIVQDTKGGAILTIQVQPKASRTECVGVHGNALKIRVAAPPVDGKANEAVIAFLAERLLVTPSAVSIRAGATGRHKRVLVQGRTAQEVIRYLGVDAHGRGAT